MRRTAATTQAVIQALQRRGLAVTARRIEGWTGAGLVPSSSIPFERHIDHYVALERYSGRGSTVDITALRLAAHGFGCARLRPALLRYFEITDPVPVPQLNLDSSEEADEAFALIEEAAREAAVEFSRVAPPALGKIFAALKVNAAKHADQTALQGEVETGDTVFHSFLVSSASWFFGDIAFNAKAMAAVGNFDPSGVEEDDLDVVNSIARIEPEDIDRAYLTLRTESIVAMAALLRGSANRALAAIECDTLTDTEVDEVCAAVAPMLVFGVRHIREHICGPGLQILAPVLDLMDEDHAISA